MIKKTLTFSERMVEMVREIKDLKGYPTFSSVIHQSIIELHTKLKPAYIRENVPLKTAEEKARAKHDIKEAELQIVIDEQIKLCKKLGGTVVDDAAGGELRCHYSTYNFKAIYEQNIPLSMLSEDMLANQYHPSKQRVEDLLAKKKTK